MRQIIKAIWKSNEVPTNEYFLWLKHEAKGFVLYVRGQLGWEPITSEGQISDVYTKEEIDTILGDYYKKTESDEKYLPLSAGETKPLTDTLYTKAIRPTTNGSALGVKNENYKFTPYVYPTREAYDVGRWGVKRATAYVGSSGDSLVAKEGIMDFEIPFVPTIKYRITVSQPYEDPSINEYQAFIFLNNGQTYHSGTAIKYGTTPLVTKVGKTSDGKYHLLIGSTSCTYAPLTTVEVEVITTVLNDVDIDTVYSKLLPTFVTDNSIYTEQYNLGENFG